ncbi:MAG: NADH:ubiquinone reductase (Na(+)-transporting) subunit C [Bacteroides sp.]
MNTNSNTYTIIYASVMVAIVAFLLAFVSNSLAPTQEANENMDKMKQILTALNVDTKEVDDVQAEFNKYVKADQIINSEAEVVKEEGGFNISLKAELVKKLENRDLPLYICEVDGETKYVIPLTVNGLWNILWGYVALNEDKNTVFGVYFAHAGETPGLGAEIATPIFQDQFANKIIMKDGSVVLSVVKNGKVQHADYEVDGITGGTITSNGVDKMIKDCLIQYKTFLTK